MNFKRQLLYLGLFILVTIAFLSFRNWDAVTAMVDNVTAASEGSELASRINSPNDLIPFLAGNPERVSLLVRDVTDPSNDASDDEPTRYALQADTPRPVSTLPKLMLLAEYYRRVEAEEVDPARRVSLRAVGVFSLEGVTSQGHERAVDSLAAMGAVRADSTASMRQVVRAAVLFNDDAAADWLMTEWGRDAVETLPGRFGMENSHAPQPTSATYLAWTASSSASVDARLRELQGFARTEVIDAVYAQARKLQEDDGFRQAQQARLQEEGPGVRLRQQRDLAEATYPRGTVSDYADLLSKIARGTLVSEAVSESLQTALEQPVPGTGLAPSDSVEVNPDAMPPITEVASKSAAYPGMLSFAGYARKPEGRPPRVVVMLAEDLPLAVLYHLVQTGIDKGLQLQLFIDDRTPERLRTVQDSLDAVSAESS